MKQPPIVIVNYGMGNLRSVSNALRRLGYEHRVSNEEADLAQAELVVVPGVGAFAEAMSNLKARGLDGALVEHAGRRGKPYLGICLGMQLLAEKSEEGGLHPGLGLIPGQVRRIPERPGLRVPHVGWNTLSVRIEEPLFLRTPQSAAMYFDHSFHVECDDRLVAATCDYGGPVAAAVQSGNVFGVQFHPEKSQVAGLKLFRSILRRLGFDA